jgi:hypothetical protein
MKYIAETDFVLIFLYLLFKIHWRMLIIECSQGCYGRTDGRNEGRKRYYIPSQPRWRGVIFKVKGQDHRLKLWLHNILVNTLESTYFNGFWLNLVHTSSLGESGTILIFKVIGQWSRSLGKIWPLDLWPWKSIGFQTLLRTKYVPSLVKIHWRMLILECSH